MGGSTTFCPPEPGNGGASGIGTLGLRYPDDLSGLSEAPLDEERGERRAYVERSP